MKRVNSFLRIVSMSEWSKLSPEKIISIKKNSIIWYWCHLMRNYFKENQENSSHSHKLTYLSISMNSKSKYQMNNYNKLSLRVKGYKSILEKWRWKIEENWLSWKWLQIENYSYKFSQDTMKIRWLNSFLYTFFSLFILLI